MRLFLHLIRTLFGVFLDALAFIHSVSAPLLQSQQKICSCVNNSASISSVR
jgi:hypothetical protein